VTSLGCCGTPARVPDPGESPDALLRLVLPLLAWVAAHCQRAGLSERVASIVPALGYPVVYAVVVAVLIVVRRGAADRRLAAMLAGLAGGFAIWIALHPASGAEFALARGDHLLAAGCGGAAIRRLPAAVRLRVLVVVSVGVLVLLAGPVAVAIVFAGMAGGVVAHRLDPTASPSRTLLVQASLMGATELGCYLAWGRYGTLGIAAQGLFAFMLLRHVSWVVDVRRGAQGSFLDYCCFQLFYPCCYGATERFADFRARNADPGAFVDERGLFRAAFRGAVYSGIWLVFPASIDLASLLTAPGRLAFAATYLLVFVRSAIFLMAVWSTLEAIALCWGMRIHPNFAGILAARSPSQFWYAWRGTMTRWLVEYVYIPLGGNRAHQVRNVFAVFAVSAAWHAMGVPFLQPTRPLAALAPIGAWALVNAVVLSVALAWRGRGWTLWPPMTPALVRTNAARLGTWVFGGVTATFLAFQSGDLLDRFPDFLTRLAGLH